MNRQRIAEIFDKIYETDALIVQPASGNDLARCQEDLAALGVPQMPADYIEFLEMANGISWNGFEFYGVLQVTVKESGYTLASIITKNENMHDVKMGLEGKLVVGRFDDDIYVYNPELESFETLDAMTLMLVDGFDTFEEMFEETVGYYAFYDDEDEDEDYPPDDEDGSLYEDQ